METGSGDHAWQRHLAEHQRIWQTLQAPIQHAELSDKRIELLRASQTETNEGVQALVGAIRDPIDRIPPENLR